jgi:O-acetyl-ADP-ribose deacetylase
MLLPLLRTFWEREHRMPASVSSPSRLAIRTVRIVRGDLASWSADALCISSSAFLEGTARKGYWKFSGRRNADGAIRQAGGAEFERICNQLAAEQAPLKPGTAIVSRAAGGLNARFVVHCLAPDGLYGADLQTSTELLQQTYSASIAAASAAGARSLALPAIGCGVQGFRPSVGARAAFQAVRAWQNSTWGDTQEGAGCNALQALDFVLFADDVWAAWPAIAVKVLGEPDPRTGPAEGKANLMDAKMEEYRAVRSGGSSHSGELTWTRARSRMDV